MKREPPSCEPPPHSKEEVKGKQASILMSIEEQEVFNTTSLMRMKKASALLD